MTCQNTNQPWVKTTQFPLKNWNLDLSYVRDIRATSEDDKSTERKLKWELHSSSDGYHMRTPTSPILQTSAVHQYLTPLHIMSQHLSSGCKDVCTYAVPVSSDPLVSNLAWVFTNNQKMLFPVQFWFLHRNGFKFHPYMQDFFFKLCFICVQLCQKTKSRQILAISSHSVLSVSPALHWNSRLQLGNP